MGSRTFCVAALSALIVGAAFVAPAAAQSNPNGTQQGAGAPSKNQTAAEREAQAKARVTVQKRSFLDAGTEVKPGQRKFLDYAYPPGYSATQPIDFTTGNIRGPLIGPWDPTRNNFWPW